MGRQVQGDRAVAHRKGATAAAVAGGSLVTGLLVNPILGVAGLVGAGYLAWDWFMFRAKRGMRF